MRTRQVIFYGAVAVVIILLLFNWKISSLGNQLQKACTIDYSSYAENGSCPCLSTRNTCTIGNCLPSFLSNFTDMNVSIKK